MPGGKAKGAGRGKKQNETNGHSERQQKWHKGESGEDGRVKGITGEQGEEERREECGRDEQKR